MLLSARPLIDVQSQNSFEPQTRAEWTEGDTVDLYLQLFDLSVDKTEQGFQPAGRRYIPAAAATLQVILENIDDSKVVTRYQSQPFTGDASIWKVSIGPLDKVRGSPQIRLVLTESQKVTRGLVKGALRVHPKSDLTILGG